MTSREYPGEDLIMTAAQKALETGDAGHILALVPEDSANMVRNLLDRACCAYRIRKDLRDPGVVWYYKTIVRLHSVRHGTRSPDLPAS